MDDSRNSVRAVCHISSELDVQEQEQIMGEIKYESGRRVGLSGSEEEVRSHIRRLGNHTRDSALGIFGIWIDPENGYVSVREDFVPEVLADDWAIKLILKESREAGMRW